jgi:hypothetical protein
VKTALKPAAAINSTVPSVPMSRPDEQGDPASASGSQARQGDLSSGESREFGARAGARKRRKRKRRKGQ